MTTPELTDIQNPNAIRDVFEAVTAILVKRGRVEIAGFGAFELRRRKPHRARNPRTGERVDVPAKIVVGFTPAAALKSRAAGITELPRD
jgi:nucleoid DNA-binding protein